MLSTVLKELKMSHFEWNIPHVPGYPNIVVTFSRNQFSSQFYRLGLFPILSGASTATDFAKRLRELLFSKSKKKKTEFSKLLFGKQNSDGNITSGLISKSKAPDFLRHLEGIVVEHKSEITHGRFTRTQLEKLIKINDLNQTIFKNALINFDKNKKIIFLDSSGNKIKKHKIPNSISEVVYVDYRNPPIILRKPIVIASTDMRMIFEQFFSLVGRGAGSRLAGAPLTILDESTQGIKTQDINDSPNTINMSCKYGDTKEMSNNFALSPRKIVIGRPYANSMQEASILVVRAIDVVSRKLEEYILKQKLHGIKIVPVEEIVEYALLQVKDWVLDPILMQYDGPPLRTHQQMDFFLVPSLKTRKILIEDIKNHENILSNNAKKILQKETQEGNLRLAIIDISGGAGGTGLSESIAKLAGYESSGYMDIYIKSLITGYEVKMGKKPKNIVLSPRKADLTLAAFEYIPFVEKLRKQGVQIEIILAEQLEEALHNYDKKKPFQVKTWDGKMIIPELIAKRFTFLGEGQEKEGDRGYIYTSLPEGVVIIPSPASRIPASDKRVNGAILEVLRPQLKQIGVDVIPSISLSIVDRNSVEKVVNEIIKFGEINADEYPEIKFLGLILKVDDKRPGREGKGDEVVSAYPISAGIFQKISNTKNQQEIKDFIHNMLFHRINNLIDKGVQNIIVQPNLLTIFADGKDFMETKIVVYSRLKK